MKRKKEVAVGKRERNGEGGLRGEERREDGEERRRRIEEAKREQVEKNGKKNKQGLEVE